MKQPTNVSWYVGRFKTQRGVVYRPLRVTIVGTLARLLNGLSKTVIERYCAYNKWKKVKPDKFVEVAGPFRSRRRAMSYAATLAGRSQRMASR